MVRVADGLQQICKTADTMPPTLTRTTPLVVAPTSMSQINSSSALAAFDFAGTVRRRSWEWFYELRHRLNMGAEIVDDRFVRVLPGPDGYLSSALGRLLTPPAHPDLRAALVTAIQAETPQLLSIDDLRIACFPLAPSRFTSGVLVLARESTAGLSGPRGSAFSGPRSDSAILSEAASDGDGGLDLESTGHWLTGVIEKHLQSACAVIDDETDALYQASSLHRVLGDAAARGSEREVLVAFAEAAAIWDDIEVRAYGETLEGEFVLDVSLAGSESSEAPTIIDRDALGPLGQEARGDLHRFVRLSSGDAERLGFRPDTKDVLLTSVTATGDAAWLVAFSGAIGPRDEVRLALYCDLVGHALNEAATLSTTRVTWGVMKPLLVSGDQIEPAAGAALDELRAAAGATAAAIVVTLAGGRHILSIGDVEAFGAGREVARGQEVFSAAPLDQFTMVMAARCRQDDVFGRRHQRIIDAARDVFAAWLPGVLRRQAYAQDRRDASAPFDRLIEREAEGRISQGASVALIVIKVPDAAFRPGWIHESVAEIRAQLRGGDLAGALTESEIAILLGDATAENAADVAARLRHRLQESERVLSRSAPAQMSIGIASRVPGTTPFEPMIRAARSDAARRRA
jgi:hypothetical protein